ncbi:hypothetical protein BSKO_10744 [Bryopsis sp. KO-2023]|nr:hypothetical protein BSKO_10744 [Bryopsis sp. KO-2023]
MDVPTDSDSPVSSAFEGRVHGRDGNQERVFDREDSCKDLTAGTYIAGILVEPDALPITQNPRNEENSGNKLIWCLFSMGFLFPPCWLVAMCLGCPQKSSPSAKKAARLSFAFFLGSVLLLISIYVLITTDFES